MVARRAGAGHGRDAVGAAGARRDTSRGALLLRCGLCLAAAVLPSACSSASTTSAHLPTGTPRPGTPGQAASTSSAAPPSPAATAAATPAPSASPAPVLAVSGASSETLSSSDSLACALDRSSFHASLGPGPRNRGDLEVRLRVDSIHGPATVAATATAADGTPAVEVVALDPSAADSDFVPSGGTLTITSTAAGVTGADGRTVTGATGTIEADLQAPSGHGIHVAGPWQCSYP